MLTQPLDYRKEMTHGSKLAARALRRKYPALAKTMLTRPKRYNETVCFCHQLAEKQSAEHGAASAHRPFGEL